MATKSLKQLTSLLNDVLTSSLDEEQTKNVLSAWESKSEEVSKLLSVANSTRGKRKKDPNAPKKGKTGYLFFCMEQRKRLKAENSQLSATEVTKHLAKEWANVSEKDKKKYLDLAEKDTARYNKEMESYTPPADTEVTETKRTRAQKKERTGPKRPLSAYMYFCADMREVIKTENPEMTGKEVPSELGRRWKALSDEEKKPYEEKQALDKERYVSEKAESVPEAKVATKEVASKATPAKAVKEVASKPAPPAKAVKEVASKPAPPAKAVKEVAQKPAPPAKAVASKPAPPAKAVKEVASKPAPPAKQEKKEPKVKESDKKTPGFEYFCTEQREELESENPEWDARKMTAELSKRWKAMSNGERNEYEQEALQESGEEFPLDE